MKYSIMLAILTITILFSVPVSSCEAKDVWVSHWTSEDIDIYVMEDTIVGNSFNENKHFTVSVKEVKDGKLVKLVDWSFSRYKTDMWRYETSTMDGTHTTVVIHKNEIFEFCMNNLGWSYRIEDMWYY